MNGKVLFDDKLHGKKRAIRPMMITRVHLQHEVRTYVCISDARLFILSTQTVWTASKPLP